MQKENLNRTRIIAVRFTAEEFAEIDRKFKLTTCRNMSQYIRKYLFNRQITVNYRDASLDALMLELIALRKELGMLGNNFNQSVKKLHTLKQAADFHHWVESTEAGRKELLDRTALIQHCVEKIARKWLQ